MKEKVERKGWEKDSFKNNFFEKRISKRRKENKTDINKENKTDINKE